MNTNKGKDMGMGAEIPSAQREAIQRLASSGDAQRLMQLLRQEGAVDQAANKAAKGDARELMERMQSLMRSGEGARLVERLTRQAKASGLGQ